MTDVSDTKKDSKNIRTIFYRIAIIFFILATFIQIPFTFFSFTYVLHLKNASVDSICQIVKDTKDHFGWSYEGNYQENSDEQ